MMAAWMGRRCIATMGGMRKAAAAAAGILTSSRFSEIIGRNSTTLAAPATVAEERQGREFHTASDRLGSFNKDKSLYLCFCENTTCKVVRHSIQSIRLSHVFAGEGEGEGAGAAPLELEEVGCRIGPDTELPFGLHSSVVGSKILFIGGYLNRISGVEFSAYPIGYISEFDSESVTTETLKPSLSPVFNKPEINKPDTSLLEVDGKLFSFSYNPGDDANPYAPWLSSRVYDPNQGLWLPLDLPPYPTYGHAVAGTNILLWLKEWEGGFCRFDVTRPEKGWTRGYCIFGPEDNLIKFIKLEDPHGYLMLSCSADFFTRPHPHTIQAFLVSQEFDSLKPMQPLHLPELPRGFFLGHTTIGCTFVHLGGPKVGLIFYNSGYDDYHYELDMMRIAFVTFEYEIVTTDDALDVKYHSPTARYLGYSPRRATWETSRLIGAYVL